MTEEEQDAVIASMVRERRDLLGKIKCLDVVLYRASEALNNARFITERARGEDYGPFDNGVEYPSPDDLERNIKDLREARQRLAILNDAIDGV